MKTQYQEVCEAINAGEIVLQQINRISSILRQASTWGYLDIFSRRSFVSSIVKHQYLDECQDEMEYLRTLIVRFNNETNDVYINENVSQINMSTSMRVMDLLLDGFIVDFIAQNKIEESKREISDLRRQVENIMNNLYVLKQNYYSKEV